MPSKVDMASLLSLAMPSPKPLALRQNGDAAVLALALHCLCIRDGFSVEDDNPALHHSAYEPPIKWDSMPDQWFFVYSKAGRANRFTLHCSLQAATQRMYVQAKEEAHDDNVQALGLQVPNYVPDTSRLKANSWQGVLLNEDKLEAYYSQYIGQPLLAQSEEAPLLPPAANGVAARGVAAQSPVQGPDGLAAWIRLTQRRDVALYLGLGAVVVGTVLWLHRRRAQRA